MSYRNSDSAPGYYRIFLSALLFIGILLSSFEAFAIELDGTLQWSRRVSLSTPVSGVVSQVFVQRGDKVEMGEKLLVLDNRALQANVDHAKAKVTQLERLLLEANRELERNEELYERTVLSDHDLELAKIANEKAIAKLAAAKAQLAQAEQDFKYSVIRAPFTGYLTKRNVEVGQTIITTQQAPELFELVDAVTMVAKAQTSYKTSRKLKKGQAATVLLGNKQFPGVIQSIGVEPENQSTTQFTVNIEFDTRGKRFRTDQNVKITIQ